MGDGIEGLVDKIADSSLQKSIDRDNASDPVTPLTPQQTAEAEARAAKEGYIHRTLVGLDQFANVLFGGSPDMTISSRLGIAALKGKWWGKAGSKFLNLFQRQHSPKAAAGDVERSESVKDSIDHSGIISQ